MKKYFAALTILGFLFLSAGGFAQQPTAKQEKPAAPAPAQRGPLANLKDFLQLTPEQEAKLQEMRKARQEAQKAFRDQMQKLRGELAPLLRDPKADQNKINGLVDQIAKLQAERTKKALADRNPLQKVLHPDQLEKLKNAPPRMGRMGRGGMMGGMPGMGPGRMMPGPGMRGGMGFGPMGGRRMMGQPGFRQGFGLGMRLGRMPGLNRFFGPQGPLGMRGRMMRRFGRVDQPAPEAEKKTEKKEIKK